MAIVISLPLATVKRKIKKKERPDPTHDDAHTRCIIFHCNHSSIVFFSFFYFVFL